jgi:SPP1 family predicted phage head-tail adaptor
MPRSSSWPSINPGDLRHRVQIQQQTSTSDLFGQPLETWAGIRTTWAGIEAIALREKFQGEFTPEVTHTITMRYPNGVTVAAGMRVVFGARVFKIQAVNDVGGRRLVLKLQTIELPGVLGTLAAEGGSTSGGDTTGGSANSVLGIPYATTPPVDGQAWIYNAANNDLEPVALSHWKRYTVVFSQLAGQNALNGTVNLFARPARQKLCGVSLYVTTSFAAPGLTALQAFVGDSAANASFYTPQGIDLLQIGNQDFNVMGSAPGASVLQVAFFGSGANLSTLTAGSLDIDVCLVNQP